MVPFGQVPKVTIRLVVEAGNVHEKADQVWLADLTGRMLQEGTAALDRRRARASVRRHGRRAVGRRRSDRATIGTDVLVGARRRRRCGSSPTSRGDPRFPAEALARVKASMARDLAIQKTHAAGDRAGEVRRS